MRKAILSVFGLILMSPAALAADCASPEGVEGEIIFNRKWKVMQYCDGDKWIGMGGGGNASVAGSTGQIQFNNDGEMGASSKLVWNDTTGTLMLNGVNAFGSNAGVTSMRYPADTGYGFIGASTGSSSNGAYVSAIGKDNTSQVVGAGGIQMGVVGVSPAMVIKGTTGNVGIGASSPNAKLHINAGTTDGLRITTTTSGPWGLTLENTTAAIRGLQIFQADNGTVRFHNNYNTGGYLVLASATARMGVNLTEPSYALHVNGVVAGSSAYMNTSDARLKTNVADIPYGLDSVLKLRPVAFEWVDQSEGWAQGRKVGLIAQEAEIVLPEVVSTADDDAGTKSIAYGDIVPVLIKAVQEQQAQIDALKAEIEALKTGH